MSRTAAKEAREFLESVRDGVGAYKIESWPQVSPGPRARRVDDVVTSLRIEQRNSVGFLDPVEDALYVTAGLRRMGFPASFHIGREVVPAMPPAGFYAWVECDGEVVSTSLPVKETYLEVYRA
ncbi:lasso peptide biosynthesis protein [Kibdelosporangium persicum]|uniref:Transglutaminase superfamily protein n=1 Tax=Kibdelosporangium persicum TaxID=2698649 RepID=A0ABX2FHE9_9PSEU|nr:lasso peptide biosynthesis protein [Kibdelosporangium persicum]NRN70231.1 Transglutaminase superfamily protein [Kibdelosporangium persicum]